MSETRRDRQKEVLKRVLSAATLLLSYEMDEWTEDEGSELFVCSDVTTCRLESVSRAPRPSLLVAGAPSAAHSGWLKKDDVILH